MSSQETGTHETALGEIVDNLVRRQDQERPAYRDHSRWPSFRELLAFDYVEHDTQMRYHDNGSFYNVSVSQAEVEMFKRNWPCSGLPDKRVTFQFDKQNGDLVDIWPYQYAALFDGDACLALAADAQAYGETRQ